MSDEGESARHPKSELDIGGFQGRLAQPSLAGILGAEGLRHAVAPRASNVKGGELVVDGASVSEIFAQVLKVVKSLQDQLQESEPLVAELQEKADSLEEKRRLLLRRAEHAERDRDVAVDRCSKVEETVKRLREEAAPAVARFMEAEVLRSQLQVSGEEIVKLKQELVNTKEELVRGYPCLAELEDDEAECAAAIAELEGAHTEEVAMLKSIHTEELAEHRAEHAGKVAHMEMSRMNEVSRLKAAYSEESNALRSALEKTRWQAEVYVREQQDAVREICLRQRENARLAKKHGEARQEALELAVRLEALKAAEEGAPAREAELQAVRKRYALLQQTASEWREALVRKQSDCDAWRKRAEQRGSIGRIKEDDDLEAEMKALMAPPTPSRPSRPSSPMPSGRGRFRMESGPFEVDGGFEHSVSALSPSPIPANRMAPWSGVPTPTRTPAQTPSRRNQLEKPWQQASQQISWQKQQWQQQRGRTGRELFMPPARQPSQERGVGGMQRTSSMPAPLPPSRKPPFSFPQAAPQEPVVRGGEGAMLRAPSQHPAGEFLAVVLKAALLRAEAEEAAGRAGIAESEAADGGGDVDAVLGGPLPPGVGEESDVGKSIVEAENEVEMLTFLLEEADASEAEVLLEMEAQQRQQKQPVVAARLRAQIEEVLARGRRRRSLSPPELTS